MDEKTNKYLEEVKIRELKASLGPWFSDDPRFPGIYHHGPEGKCILFQPNWNFPVEAERNLDFVSHAREDIPRLIEIIESQSKKLEEARKVIEECRSCFSSINLNWSDPRDWCSRGHQIINEFLATLAEEGKVLRETSCKGRFGTGDDNDDKWIDEEGE